MADIGKETSTSILSKEKIKEIKTKADFISIASKYVRLSKRGDRYWGCCPFHKEDTPSFNIKLDGENSFYHCFGCNKSGNVFDFVQEVEHVGFYEAVRKIADISGVKISYGDKPSEDGNLSKLYQINKECQTIFEWALEKQKVEDSDKAKEYLKSRCISDETTKQFKLGFAPSQGSFLSNVIKDKYSKDELVNAGLLSKVSGFCVFQDRIVFPIRNQWGKTIGFSGRSLSSDNMAKYINSPETDIYKKKDNLFGIFESKKAIIEQGEAILCEGNFDVVSLYEAGICNAVAPLGTAFTENQAVLLGKLTKKVKLAFDSDLAGQNGLEKAVILCQKHNIETKILNLGRKDPSEVLEKDGKGSLKKLVDEKNLMSGFDFLLKYYKDKAQTDIKKVFDLMLPFLESTESAIWRSFYIKRLAEELKVDEWAVYEDFPQLKRNNETIHVE